MAVHVPRSLPDHGGGSRLESHHVVSVGPSEHALFVRGPEGVVEQLRIVEPGYREVRRDRAGYDVLRGPGRLPRPEVRGLLVLLGQVLTLRRAPGVDVALALDWTKIPADGVDPRFWTRTDVYRLVARGKYAPHPAVRAEDVRDAGRELTARLCAVIEEHPLLHEVETVLDVPGHDPDRLGFGSKLAASVAHAQHLHLVRCVSVSGLRVPAKNLPPALRRRAVLGRLRCPENLQGQAVLVVDDLLSTGASVAESARAARRAGATGVAALVAARTMYGTVHT